MSGRRVRTRREFAPLDAYGMPPTLRGWWRATWYCLWHDHDRATPTARCERCGATDEPGAMFEDEGPTW